MSISLERFEAMDILFSGSKRQRAIRLVDGPDPLGEPGVSLKGVVPNGASLNGGATATQSEGSVRTLTPRELAVLTLVAAGRTNAAIAGQLSCSPRTVAKHLEHVYSKLHVANRAAAAARFAVEFADNRRAAR